MVITQHPVLFGFIALRRLNSKSLVSTIIQCYQIHYQFKNSIINFSRPEGIQMNKESARKIIKYVVGQTERRWREYDKSWHDINNIMILHGYEQGGFEFLNSPLIN